MITDYLGIQHEYGKFDCIILCKLFYEKELVVSFDIPQYTHSKSWMKEYTTTNFDLNAAKYGTKVSLTEAKNYDLMVFRSLNSNLLIHFGIFLMPNKLLHIEENNSSKIETLSDYWLSRLYAVYRHNELV